MSDIDRPSKAALPNTRVVQYLDTGAEPTREPWPVWWRFVLGFAISVAVLLPIMALALLGLRAWNAAVWATCG